MAPAEAGTAFVPFIGDLADIRCGKHERIAGNDNCVRLDGRCLPIPEQHHRQHFVRVGVNVHEYPDGTLAIFHGPRRLADDTANGTLIAQAIPTRSAA